MEDHAYQRAQQIWARLLKDRIVFIGLPIDDYISSLITAQLLSLNAESRTRPAHIYLNSPGGAARAGLAIVDSMDLMACPVHTYCVGEVFGMATLILAHGKKGQRFLARNSRVGIGPLWGGTGFTGRDAEIFAQEAAALKKTFIEILAKDTGQASEHLDRVISREQYFTPEEAIRFGLADQVAKVAP